MKLLILKTNQFMNQEMLVGVQNSLNEALQTGLLILDGNFTYEVVELSQMQVQNPIPSEVQEPKEVDAE